MKTNTLLKTATLVVFISLIIAFVVYKSGGFDSSPETIAPNPTAQETAEASEVDTAFVEKEVPTDTITPPVAIKKNQASKAPLNTAKANEKVHGKPEIKLDTNAFLLFSTSKSMILMDQDFKWNIDSSVFDDGPDTLKQ